MNHKLHPKNQEEIDEIIFKTKNSCKNCTKLRIEIKAVQKTLNTILNQTLSELTSTKKECEQLRQTLEQQAKD